LLFFPDFNDFLPDLVDFFDLMDFGVAAIEVDFILFALREMVLLFCSEAYKLGLLEEFSWICTCLL
jgi:hypothetical protein